MIKALNVIAIIFILIGVVVFFVSLDGIKDLKFERDYWIDAAEENITNELIQAEADRYNQAYISKITTSIVSLLSGIVTGIFFLSIAKIISVLEKIRKSIDERNNREQLIINPKNNN